MLYAFYLTNKIKLDEHWTLTGGFGQAQTPPTLIERYADGLFLNTLQTGYNHMIGNPNLMPERDWQIDLGLAAKYENWRMPGSTASMPSCYDYITFRTTGVGRLPRCPAADFANTPLGDPGGRRPVLRVRPARRH